MGIVVNSERRREDLFGEKYEVNSMFKLDRVIHETVDNELWEIL